MNLTPEVLALLKKLQPQIRKAMGAWQVGDHFLPNEHWTYPEVCAAVKGNLPCTSAEFGGPWRLPLRIPSAIPLPGQPVERTLIGMCKGFVTLGKALYSSVWFVQVHLEPNITGKYFASFKADTPYLALLKAIEAQQGGEEK